MRFWPFLVWLICFYTVWGLIVFAGDRWETVKDHWPIAAAMAAGSYVAGSTPMGGGTVGFPVLVLLFDLPASLGRNFGLAVQSIGMTSASIFILCARRPVDWPLLRPAMLGSLIGTPFGAILIAPVVPSLTVKILFSVIWASFGILHLAKLRTLVASTRSIPDDGPHRAVGLTIGLTGGVVASLTGVGIDMILYAVMVLMYRTDLKIAIPASVILMAFTSLIGIATNVILARAFPSYYEIDPAVFANWLAAAPIVAVGAPIGALVVNFMPRSPTLVIVSLLCLGQFVWTCASENLSVMNLTLALVSVLGMNLAFVSLYRRGEFYNSRSA